MSDFTVKSVSELEFYQGPHAREGIRFRYAGKALGVSAWGMNVLEIAPHCTNYPEHDHAKDGQEEVYTALEGTATLVVGGQTQVLKPGVLVRVGPSVTRKIITGDSGATILAIGATPGAVYAGR